MKVSVRPARLSDCEGMLKLYAPYVEETAISFEYEIPTLSEFQERFRSISGWFPWLLCEVEGELAGYAYASAAFERAAYQWDADLSVYLSPRFHRLGIASQFYGCLEQLLALQGYFKLYALVTSENERSLKFHRARGFQEVATFRRTGYKFGRWHGVTWLERDIGGSEFPEAAPCAFSQVEPGAVENILARAAEQLEARLLAGGPGERRETP